MHPIDRLQYFNSYPIRVIESSVNLLTKKVQRFWAQYQDFLLGIAQEWIRDNFFIVNSKRRIESENE